MSLHYLVKYLCSINDRAPEEIGANCHVRLSHSKSLIKYLSSKIVNKIVKLI